MIGSGGSIVDALLILSVIWIVAFLVCREIFCWYLKINQTVALLTEIRDLLAPRTLLRTAPSIASPPPVEVAADASMGSRNAARNLAASGYTVEQISKELHKWHGLSSAEANELARSVKSEPLP